jgi:hypothetical protein
MDTISIVFTFTLDAVLTSEERAQYVRKVFDSVMHECQEVGFVPDANDDATTTRIDARGEDVSLGDFVF